MYPHTNPGKGGATLSTQRFVPRGAGGRIGDLLQPQAIWTLKRRRPVTGRYEHLATSAALAKAGCASSDFLAGSISFPF